MVVNTAARRDTGVANSGARWEFRWQSTLGISLAEIGRSLVALRAINRQRDSLELPRDFLDSMPACRVSVLRNLNFGDESNSSRAPHPKRFDCGSRAGAASRRTDVGSGHCEFVAN